MSDDIAPPIEVHPSPVPDQAWAALRQIAPPVMAFALGRHWIADDLAALLAVAGGILWPIVVGQLKTRRRATELTTIAGDPRTPDDVATVKGA